MTRGKHKNNCGEYNHFMVYVLIYNEMKFGDLSIIENVLYLFVIT